MWPDHRPAPTSCEACVASLSWEPWAAGPVLKSSCQSQRGLTGETILHTPWPKLHLPSARHGPKPRSCHSPPRSLHAIPHAGPSLATMNIGGAASGQHHTGSTSVGPPISISPQGSAAPGNLISLPCHMQGHRRDHMWLLSFST